jgi:hypothetical protein
MALDASALHSAVLAHLGTSQASTAAAAAAFAKVYDDYAAGGMFGASTPTLTGRKAIFEGVLAAGLAAGVFATSATALGNAVSAYWGPAPSPVPVVGVQAGTVVGCPGASAIAASLAALLPSAPKATAATALAAALHTATQTVTATVTPPPGTTLTIA